MAPAGGRDREVEARFREPHASLVRGLTLAAGSAEAAADAVQDAFVQLHRHGRKVSAYEEPAAWLRRVAVNRVRDQRRGLRRRDVAVGRRPAGSPAGRVAGDHAAYAADETGQIVAYVP